MKTIIGLLFALCLVTIPVIPSQAASFGLSPAMVDYQIEKGATKTIEFTVVGYTGTVDISSESMPVSVSPASVSAVAGSKIIVTIKCNEDATDGLYEGKIVFLAKSGNSVMSGIKARCNLTVGNSSSPATYGGKGGASSSGSSSGYVVSSDNPALDNGGGVVTPLTSSSSLIDDMKNQGKDSLPVPSGADNNFNFVLIALIVVSGLLLIGAFFVGFNWMQQRKNRILG